MELAKVLEIIADVHQRLDEIESNLSDATGDIRRVMDRLADIPEDIEDIGIPAPEPEKDSE